MENKSYVKCSLVDQPYIMKGYIDSYYIKEEILVKLSRDIGFSYDMYKNLYSIDPDIAERFVVSMCKNNKCTDIYFLVNDNHEALGYSLDPDRLPILNSDFMKRVESLIETSSEVEISEKYQYPEDLISSFIIKRVDPVEIDYDEKHYTYDIGILLVNNEVDSTYSRLVVYVDNQPIYLPASYYNSTTNRYKKSTSSSTEALEVLVLKIIDDLRSSELEDKIKDFNHRYLYIKEIATTYEEYNTLLRTMMKIPSIIDDRSILDSLMNRYDDFEKKYAHLDDKKSSYIWRCTAIGDLTIGNLVHITSSILNELSAPSIEYYNIRELIGSYLSTSRIAVEIAREDK